MRDPRTKIVCTLGPASADAATIEAMIRAGADVFRVNGAHVGPEAVAAWVDRVREAGEAAGSFPAVLLDLPGTKIRVGEVPEEGVLLEEGRTVRLVDARTGDGRATIPLHPTPHLDALPVGSEVLLQDGQIRLEVVEVGARGARARVLDGGTVRKGMGVHVRGVSMPAPVPTDHDRALVEAGVKAGVDWLSQSFVRNGDDVGRLKDLIGRLGRRNVPIVAKIERLAAIESLDEIAALADALMVARGDLGVDAAPEQVPSLQLRILEAGRRAARPVIVATEMLESMTRNPRPTRAEASDVATAVFQGADAVMLSGETAVGSHPALVVRTMARVLAAAEADPAAPYAGSPRMTPPGSQRGRPDQHVVRAAVGLAQQTRAAAIVVFSRSGMSAIRLSKERPEAAVHAFAPRDEVCRRLALAWGVRPKRLPAVKGTDAVVREVREHLRTKEGLAGARAVLVMGGANDAAGATTMIQLLTL